MVRRLRLIDEPERRSPAERAAALGNRIKDGLLRDNKVVPAVLAVLALLVFAWVLASLFMGGGTEEGQQQASKGAAPSQTPRETTSNESSGAPTPGTDNRDTESFAAFGSPKDPFELPKGIGSKASGPTNESTNGSTTSRSGGSGGNNGNNSNGGSRAGSGGTNSGGSRAGSGGNTNGGGSRAGSGGAGNGGSRAGSGGGGNGGAGETTNAGGGNAGGDSNSGLFNSGGDLPAP